MSEFWSGISSRGVWDTEPQHKVSNVADTLMNLLNTLQKLRMWNNSYIKSSSYMNKAIDIQTAAMTFNQIKP